MDQFTLAVLSDLHCHAQSEPERSHLLAGAPRYPILQHPIEALLKRVRDDELVVDAVVAPGDLSDRISQAGLQQAWEHLLELQSALKAQVLIATVGNHDIDSRRQYNQDPFRIARNLRPGFLFEKETDAMLYWQQGFCTVPLKDRATFLVLNSAIDHHSVEEAEAGTFGEERIERMEAHLKATVLGQLRIAVMHHHPLLHSLPGFSSEDVIPTGDKLLRVLHAYGFNLVIHGHRHQPRITYSSDGVVVFASGSFSAILTKMSSYTRNVFHIVNIHDLTPARPIKIQGMVRTWEFNLGDGWNPATGQSASVPHVTGFGVNDLAPLISKLSTLLGKSSTPFVPDGTLVAAVPELNLLLPQDFLALESALQPLNLKFVFDRQGRRVGLGRPELFAAAP